jgi:prepilin-type N-terminal cleavage/methylation domain-containing protein
MKTHGFFRSSWEKGLSLTELAVAMAVAGILLAAGYGIFLTQQKTYAVQDQVAEIQQNARVAMNLLMRDVRMAGHGVPTLWPVVIGGNTYSDTVTAAGDTLTLLGCFGAPRGYLSRSANVGAREIQLVDASDFDTGDRRYVFVGEYDKNIIERIEGNRLFLIEPLTKRYPTTRLTAQSNPGDTEISVTDTAEILAGDILTLGNERLYVTLVSGDSISFSNPLELEYPVGTRVNPIPVYFVQALQYVRGSDNIITREDLSGGGRQHLAENIEALSFTEVAAGTFEIALTAETDVPDGAGRNRSRAYRFTVRGRNPL